MCVQNGTRFSPPIGAVENAWKVLVMVASDEDGSSWYETPWEKMEVSVGDVMESVDKSLFYSPTADGLPRHGFHAYLKREAAKEIIDGFYRQRDGFESPVLARVTLWDVFEVGDDHTDYAFRERVAVGKRMRVEEVVRVSSIEYGQKHRLAVVD